MFSKKFSECAKFDFFASTFFLLTILKYFDRKIVSYFFVYSLQKFCFEQIKTTFPLFRANSDSIPTIFQFRVKLSRPCMLLLAYKIFINSCSKTCFFRDRACSELPNFHKKLLNFENYLLFYLCFLFQCFSASHVLRSNSQCTYFISGNPFLVFDSSRPTLGAIFFFCIFF
jgi:hypothetical protein